MLVLGRVLILVLVPKLTVPHAKEYAAQFSADRTDYDAAVAFLKTLTKKFHQHCPVRNRRGYRLLIDFNFDYQQFLEGLDCIEAA